MLYSATTEAPPSFPIDIPYQGSMNVLGIMLVFWSFRRLLEQLLKISDYKEIIAQQADILRNQTRMIENQSRMLRHIIDRLEEAKK